MTNSKFIGALVAAVTAITFVLSYSALVTVADANGKTGVLSYLWPLAIDLPIVVFSLSGLLAALRGDDKLRYVSSSLVIMATAATVYFNVAETPPHWLVAAVAPVMYFASFEVFVLIIRTKQETFAQMSDKTPVSASPSTTAKATDKPATDTLAVANDTRKTKADDRRARILSLLNEGVTDPDKLAELEGVTVRTIRRDIRALNGQVQQQ